MICFPAAARRLIFCTAAGSLMACAAPKTGAGGSLPPVSIDRSAAGSAVQLRPGQTLLVTLAGNPTTGFLWELRDDGVPVLERRGEPEFRPGGAAIGAGGSYTFAFKGAAPGSTKIQFVYRRPFEKQVAPADRFEVTVEVR